MPRAHLAAVAAGSSNAARRARGSDVSRIPRFLHGNLVKALIMDCPRTASRTLRTSLLTAAAVAAAASLAASPLAACVPTGTAPAYDAGAKGPAKANVKQSPDVMTELFEDNFDRAPKPNVAPSAATTPASTLTSAASSSGPTNAATASTMPVRPTARPALIPFRDDGGTGPRGRMGSLWGESATDAGADSAKPVPNPFSTLPAATATSPVLPTPLDETGIGPNWKQTSLGAWRIENGKLCGKSAKNQGIWLARTLPINARIEFEATAQTPDGDLKAELWGDGISAATTVSYTNATSYLTILGGWKNTFHVLARVNEHAADRKQIKIDHESDDPRAQMVSSNQPYRFKVERSDGHTVRWSVNGTEYLAYDDPEPLAGIGHDHFGFNNWEVKVCFDNVRVTPLP
jgi:Domain of unknown function (DUF6250)